MAEHPIRIPPATAGELNEAQAALLGGWGTMNFAAVLVHHPEFYAAFMPLIAKVIAGTNLPPHDRQILVLRTLALCDEDYEARHHAMISRTAGLDEAAIVAAADVAAPLAGFDAVLAKAAAELVRGQNLRDETWAELAERYSRAQLMELVGLVGTYTTMAMLTKSFGIPVEDETTFASFTQKRDYV